MSEKHPGFRSLNGIASREPDNVWAHVGLGLAYLRVWDGDASFLKSKQHFERVVLLRPDWGWGHLLLGEAQRSLLDYAASLASYDRAIALDPALAAWGHAFRSRVLFQMGTSEDGLPDMERALALAPDTGWMLAWRGEAFRRLGRSEEAAADFERALSLDPLYDQAYVWRAKLLQTRGEFDAALASLKKGIALCPDFEKAHRVRIRVLRAAGRTKEALAALRDAAELNHRNNWLGLWEAEPAPAEQPQWSALEELDDYLRAHPKDLWAHAWRGETLCQMGRLEDALAEFDRVGEWASGRKGEKTLSAWASAWRGEALFRANRIDEALAELNKAVKGDPSYGRSWAWRGKVRAAAGDWAGAAADYDRAISERRVEYAWLYVWRAQARQKLGRAAEADADFELAARLDPNVRTYAGI